MSWWHKLNPLWRFFRNDIRDMTIEELRAQLHGAQMPDLQKLLDAVTAEIALLTGSAAAHGPEEDGA